MLRLPSRKYASRLHINIIDEMYLAPIYCIITSRFFKLIIINYKAYIIHRKYKHFKRNILIEPSNKDS